MKFGLQAKSLLVGAALLVVAIKWVAPRVPAVASVTSKLT
jgi:hypothetical protein